MAVDSADYYATCVLAVIADRMPRLATDDEIAAEVIKSAIADHYRLPSGHLEIILDGQGNWRLKANPAKPGRVRLADYRMHMIGKSEDPAVTAVNEALEAL